MTAALSLPAWEVNDLTNLGAQGSLSGLPPVVLEVIDKEESSGQGGGINPEGYGGFFGLGEASSYPGGSTTPAMLSDPSEGSFLTQAKIAASAFASYLTQAGGDPVQAEQIYQTGQAVSASNPEGGGAQLMAQILGGSGTITPSASSAPNAQLTGLNANPLDLFGIPQTIGGSVASSIWHDVGPFIAKALLVVAGLAMVVLGVYRLSSSTGASQKIDNAAKLAGLAAA